tara:strand:- start:33 stop:749 length:717 start_codon:yes stop_codon:yes gene_type:complete
MSTECANKKRAILYFVLGAALYTIMVSQRGMHGSVEHFVWGGTNTDDAAPYSADEVLTVTEAGEIVKGRRVSVLEARITQLEQDIADLKAFNTQNKGGYAVLDAPATFTTVTTNILRGAAGRVSINSHVDIPDKTHLQLGAGSNIVMGVLNSKASGKILLNTSAGKFETIRLGGVDFHGTNPSVRFGALEWRKAVYEDGKYAIKTDNNKALDHNGNTDDFKANNRGQGKFKFTFEKSG